MDINYYGITVEICSVPTVTPQQAIPAVLPQVSPANPQNSRSITAIPITVQVSTVQLIS